MRFGARQVAWCAWLGFATACAAPRATDREVVLCIGDSFTDGVGPDGPSKCYPSALSRHLEEAAPGRFLVVQRSYPGGDSRRLVLDLPAVLERVRPVVTYLLVGVNDGYSMPDAVSPSELDREGRALDAEGAAVLRCFEGGKEVVIDGLSIADPGWTPLMTGDAGKSAQLTELEVAGAWHFAAETIEFTPEGRLETRFGRFAWHMDDGRLVVAGNGAVIEMGAWRDGSRLILADATGEPLISLSPGPSDSAAAAVDLATRRAEFEESPNWISALWLARAEREAGLVEDAAEHCAWILVRAEFNYPAMDLLRALAQVPATRERCLAGVARSHDAADEGDPAKSLGERLDALIRGSSDPDGAARNIVNAFRRDRDWRATVRLLRTHPAIDADRLASAAASVGADAETAQAILAVHANLGQADERIAKTLRSHFETIAALCRGVGSSLAVLDYPVHQPALAPAFVDLPRDVDCRAIGIGAWFAAQSPSERSRLIDFDGHCTAAGYEAMARLVAADALAKR